MTAKPAPKKLGKEPLIDVICGIHFESTYSVDALLPGLLLSKLIGKTTKFEALPAAQLPQMMRENDPALRNAPLMRVVVDEQFAVLIGSKWLGVGCLMPYAGWAAYKPMIEMIFAVLKDVPSVKNIERLSMKYVDFMDSALDGAPLSRLQLQIDIAGQRLSNQVTQLRTEIIDSPFVHAVTIFSHATATRPDKPSSDGVVVDVDTHMVQTILLQDFLVQMPDLLESIHTANKGFFFNLLTDSGLKELEPAYE
jgi:uncharacterized protein (TIGR04255 family)